MFLPAGVGGRVQHKINPQRAVISIIVIPKTHILTPCLEAKDWRRVIPRAAINQINKEISEVINTFLPLLHFFGSFGGINFHEGINRISVANIPKRQAMTESVRCSTVFVSSVKIM